MVNVPSLSVVTVPVMPVVTVTPSSGAPSFLSSKTIPVIFDEAFIMEAFAVATLFSSNLSVVTVTLMVNHPDLENLTA